jgi:hypothetical protein
MRMVKSLSSTSLPTQFKKKREGGKIKLAKESEAKRPLGRSLFSNYLALYLILNI